ncbi:MAG TPA: hypothetical protein VK527_11115, partial [Candidatus Limnocylindrales bacterium]|nr:hypothetical protein [Candidatus Limnocylindrales bacterium]
LAPPRDAAGRSEIIATRLQPSSLSARYGSVVAVNETATGGTYLAPTRTGVEFRGSNGISDILYGTFRTAGTVDEAVWTGSTAYLLAGDRGIVAVDASDSTNLVAIGGHDHLGVLKHGAFARASRTLAAASDTVLYLLRETAPGVLDLIDTREYRDGRRVVRVQARSDSFLVLSLRPTLPVRLFLTLYRARSGAAPESLWDFQANGFQALDLVWPDAMAFVAVGNGILPFNTETRLAGGTVAVGSGGFVRDVAADAASVVAVGEARLYAQFTRSGPKGGTLTSEVDRLTSIEPFEVSVVGGLAIVSENDQVPPPGPDEAARGLLEILDVGQPAVPGRITTAGLGRVRRVVLDQGLAYVADYTGGLRIYRGGSADTSLVGAFTVAGNALVYDLSIDRARHIAYLAAGTAGLIVVDVADPAAPTALSSLALPGIVTAVTVIDTSLVAVGRRGGGLAGVTFADVANVPLGAAPIARGSMNFASVQEPRALAAKDTVLFVADQTLGLLSIGFGNPDVPTTIGSPSVGGASDLDLSGNQLIVVTIDGVQVVNVVDPAAPLLLATVLSPPAFGVTQSGQTAIALLGDGGALAIDLRTPSVPLVRGIIQVPGFSRDAAWVGDTLLIAQSFGLERYRASAVVGSDPALALTTDAASVRPNVRITWTIPAPAGAIGWNIYRDPGTAAQGIAASPGLRVNDPLLGLTVTSFSDVTVQAATSYRYRLEAFFQDGSSRKVAEGAIHIGSNAALGRPYPNPYRPRNGSRLSIPYRALSVDAGKSIELRVYDAAGRLLRRIPGTVAPGGGFGSLTWDGRDDRGRLVSDGVYFAHLTGPGIDDARQLILLR